MRSLAIGSVPFISIEEGISKHIEAFSVASLPHFPKVHGSEFMFPLALGAHISIDSEYTQVRIDEDFYISALKNNEIHFGNDLALESFHRTTSSLSHHKLQVVGPYTFNQFLPSFPKLKSYANQILRNKILYLSRLFRDSNELILFFDEPSLFLMQSHEWSPWRNNLQEITDGIPQNVSFGIHCCSKANWDRINADCIKYLSVDFELYSDSLELYRQLEHEQFEVIVGLNALNKDFDHKVDSFRKLNEDVLISPSCGFANYNPNEVDTILELFKKFK